MNKTHIITHCRMALIPDNQELKWVQNAHIMIHDGAWSVISDKKLQTIKKVKRISGKKMLLLPGLTNAHTHIAMGFLRGFQYARNYQNVIAELMFKVETHLNSDLVYALSRLGALEALLSGCTRVVDHYYYGDAVAQACKDVRIQGLIGETAMDLAGPKKTKKDQERSFDFVARWMKKNDPLIDIAIAPHATDTVSENLMKDLVQLAHQHKCPLHFHLAQTQDEWNVAHARHNCTPTELAARWGALGKNTIVAHAIHVSDSDLKILKDHDVSVAYCPASQVMFEKLAPIDQFKKHQLNILLSTDCVCSADHLSVLRESVTALLFEKNSQRVPPNPLFPLIASTRRFDRFENPDKRGNNFVLCDLSRHEHMLLPDIDLTYRIPFLVDQFPVSDVFVQDVHVVKDGVAIYADAKEIQRDADKAMKWLLKKAG